MRRYFEQASARDAAWAIYYLSGRRQRQTMPTRVLRELAAEEAGIPEWLFEESYGAVGDTGEAIALLLPSAEQSTAKPLHYWVEDVIIPLRRADDEERRRTVLETWRQMDNRQRFVFNKLLTGGFRVGVSQRLVTRALAQVSGINSEVIAHRLMGNWQPSPEFFEQLLDPDTQDADNSRPYPFFLAYPLEDEPSSLGEPSDWQVEWKWDGIRAQLIRRAGESYLWSRGEELVTPTFPELDEMAAALPDGVAIDGEILVWIDDKVQPFAQLQRRLGRKRIGKKLLAEVPVILLAYDLLEFDGVDIRDRPLEERRAQLQMLIAATNDSRLQLSPQVEAGDWDTLTELREESRARGVEGFMLKRHGSPYRVGRVRGDWWKWKVDPYTVDAVLIYAQRGSGRRASLYTDYTFAVWDDDQLVPFAKAYSGLTDAEIRKVDRFVRQNTQDRFGPVRSVTPQLVFELAFENIRRSTRHKSGVAVRFPRILRWRHDKPIAEADTLEQIKAMLPESEA